MGSKKSSKSAENQLSRLAVGVSPSWLRHRILIPAFKGSSPFSPASFFIRGIVVRRFNRLQY
jgi:hypothetical protein